ncbi:hypothetical protein TNCV_843851 [Trichonephila clavipes]|nr:hypothetical protein TNCV_843851 [Trichonephila clavipes]
MFSRIQTRSIEKKLAIAQARKVLEKHEDQTLETCCERWKIMPLKCEHPTAVLDISRYVFANNKEPFGKVTHIRKQLYSSP